MSRNLYSPKLSDDVVCALYREGQRRRMPMTRLADELLRHSLESNRQTGPAILRVCEGQPLPVPTNSNTHAA